MPQKVNYVTRFRSADPFKKPLLSTAYPVLFRRRQIEFLNASSFFMEYEVIWKNKPKPRARHKCSVVQGQVSAGVNSAPNVLVGADRQTSEFAEFEHELVFRDKQGPNTANDPDCTLRCNVPRGCKELWVTAKAGIHGTDDPNTVKTVKEKTYNVQRTTWSLTSKNARILPYFPDLNDEDLKRLRDRVKAHEEEQEDEISTQVSSDVEA